MIDKELICMIDNELILHKQTIRRWYYTNKSTYDKICLNFNIAVDIISYNILIDKYKNVLKCKQIKIWYILI